MDISTISRVTSDKYVQTDWGVFNLKYFFTEKMQTESGTEVSNSVIKQRIKELIEAEDKSNPLSDNEITDQLKNDGYKVERRTVAKYRELLKIPVARYRRELL